MSLQDDDEHREEHRHLDYFFEDAHRRVEDEVKLLVKLSFVRVGKSGAEEVCAKRHESRKPTNPASLETEDPYTVEGMRMRLL